MDQTHSAHDGESPHDRAVHSPWLKFIRFYVDKTIKLCRLNAAGELDGFGPSVASRQLPVWSHLAQIFYFYFSAKLVVSLVLQHNYNLIKHELGTKLCGRQLDLTNKLRLEAKQAEHDSAVARITLVGNPFYELGFGTEILFVIILTIVYLGYAQTRLYVAARGPVEFAALQMLLDPERERSRTCERDIQREAGKFLASSANFWLAQRELFQGAALENIGSGQEMAVGSLPLAGRERNLELAHRRAAREVREMLATGALVPPNRRPAWTLRAAKIFGTMIVLFQVTSTCFLVCTTLVLHWSGAWRFTVHTGPRDLVFQAELFLYGTLGLQAVGSNLLIILVCALDQAEFVRQLRRRLLWLADAIRSCDPHRETDDSHHHHHHHLLNRRLMRALILYKMFHAQLRATQPVVGFMGAHISFLMLMLPVLGRIYAAYLPHEFRLAVLASGLFIILVCDVLVLPACHLNARCLDMFRALAHLLAHLDAQQQQQQAVAGPYDAHTVWLLRRELNLPELTVRRFATDAHFLRLTYSDFLGIHFWCGLLLAPLVLRDTGRLATSGNLLADSLRLF